MYRGIKKLLKLKFFLSIVVGAALCGRPCVDLRTGAATEGRPYS